ncbi:MAG: 2-hydroxychromene-2-carboxylate isomerase [Henriciella sp.]
MKVEIWFEFASTYSYLTVSRAEEAFKQANVSFVWRPFLLGPIFRAKGWETSPFVLDEVKGAYMWRDLARRAERFGLPFKRPPVFPMHTVQATRIMTAALDEPWCGSFAREVFSAEFARGQDISDPDVLADALDACGADPEIWFAHAGTDATKTALRARTDEAARLGIFGAPSFRVGDELFWGDDRLEDAIIWAQERR